MTAASGRWLIRMMSGIATISSPERRQVPLMETSPVVGERVCVRAVTGVQVTGALSLWRRKETSAHEMGARKLLAPLGATPVNATPRTPRTVVPENWHSRPAAIAVQLAAGLTNVSRPRTDAAMVVLAGCHQLQLDVAARASGGKPSDAAPCAAELPQKSLAAGLLNEDAYGMKVRPQFAFDWVARHVSSTGATSL